MGHASDCDDHGGPLRGVVVADFSRVLAGPLATMMLGDMGASVVKVERPGSGDDTRAWGPPFVGDDSAYYLSVNRNKRSLDLDLGSERGLDAAFALVDRSDVLIENFSPGTMERLGFGWPALHARNPGLVYCSISGFGRGRGADLAGYDFLVQALGGLMSITGEPGGRPTKVGVALVDVITGLHAALGVLAALRERDATGHGQLVEVNLLSSLLSALVNQSSSFLAAGVVPQRQGNQHPNIAPYELLEVGDGMLAMSVGNDRQFRSLCSVLGLDDLPDDERFSCNAARVANRTLLIELLSAPLREATIVEWTARLNGAGVPCGPVNDIQEAFRFAEDLNLGPIHEIERPDGTMVRQVANPIRFSATPVEYRLAPPRLGEQTSEILAWLSRSSKPPEAT